MVLCWSWHCFQLLQELIALSRCASFPFDRAAAQADLYMQMPKEAKRRLRAYHGIKEDASHEEDEEDEEIDRLTKEDAYTFPILGSVVLFGLYCCFKYLPKIWINRIIGGYMSLMGVGASARMAVSAVQALTSEKKWKGLSMVSRCASGMRDVHLIHSCSHSGSSRCTRTRRRRRPEAPTSFTSAHSASPSFSPYLSTTTRTGLFPTSLPSPSPSTQSPSFAWTRSAPVRRCSPSSSSTTSGECY
jgi:hypothetical protein